MLISLFHSPRTVQQSKILISFQEEMEAKERRQDNQGK